MSEVYKFSAIAIDGEEKAMSEFAGKVLLIVNTASQCGFTPQYAELESLYRKYAVRGFSVLGFPCNQFGAQEPADPSQISRFCHLTYDVTFPLFSKIEVNGKNAHPLYQFLKAKKPGLFGTRAIKWNFTKFLVDRHGEVKARFAPLRKPMELSEKIDALL